MALLEHRLNGIPWEVEKEVDRQTNEDEKLLPQDTPGEKPKLWLRYKALSSC